jgi:hypothetical protein
MSLHLCETVRLKIETLKLEHGSSVVDPDLSKILFPTNKIKSIKNVGID